MKNDILVRIKNKTSLTYISFFLLKTNIFWRRNSLYRQTFVNFLKRKTIQKHPLTKKKNGTKGLKYCLFQDEKRSECIFSLAAPIALSTSNIYGRWIVICSEQSAWFGFLISKTGKKNIEGWGAERERAKTEKRETQPWGTCQEMSQIITHSPKIALKMTAVRGCAVEGEVKVSGYVRDASGSVYYN